MQNNNQIKLLSFILTRNLRSNLGIDLSQSSARTEVNTGIDTHNFTSKFQRNFRLINCFDIEFDSHSKLNSFQCLIQSLRTLLYLEQFMILALIKRFP